VICIYTEFKRNNNNHAQVVCVYCNKLLIDLKENWSFSIDFHPKIKDMMEKDLLVCDCEYAKKDKKLKQTIKMHEHKIKECKEGLSDLLYSVNPLPF